MSIDEFQKEVEQNLKDFLTHWQAMHKISPEHWPTELGGGEWWEQFIAWDGGEVRS